MDTKEKKQFIADKLYGIYLATNKRGMTEEQLLKVCELWMNHFHKYDIRLLEGAFKMLETEFVTLPAIPDMYNAIETTFDRLKKEMVRKEIEAEMAENERNQAGN